MAIEIKINSEKVDVDDKPIGVTMQATDIGDIGRIKADVTSAIQLKNTAKNHKAMNHSGILGSEGNVQLGQINAEIISNGVPLLSNAKARISNVKNGGYDINIFGGNYGFIEQLEDKTLRDFDWTAYDFIADTAGSYFRNLYEADSGITFPICEYRKDPYYRDGMLVGRLIEVTSLMPWIFVHTVVTEIVTQSGYKITGDVLPIERYLKMVMATTPIGQLYASDTGNTVNITEMMPEISAAEFIKGLLFQFGAFIITIEKTLHVIQFKNIYSTPPITTDWSDKFDSTKEPSIQYEIGYAQNNIYQYAETDNPELSYEDAGRTNPLTTIQYDLTPDITDGTIVSDNKNLGFRKVIKSLPFEGIQSIEKFISSFFSFTINRITIPWLQGTESIDGVQPSYDVDWGLKIMILANVTTKYTNGSDAIFTFTRDIKGTPITIYTDTLLRIGYFDELRLSTESTSATSADLKLIWDDLHDDYFFEIENSLLKNPTKVIAQFYLDEVDINNYKEMTPDSKIGRAVPVYVRQLNGHYYINKIDKFIAGKMTKVELIRL